MQCAAIVVGVAVAFLLSGILHQHFGMAGVAWMGALLGASELIGTPVFFILEGITTNAADSDDNNGKS